MDNGQNHILKRLAIAPYTFQGHLGLTSLQKQQPTALMHVGDQATKAEHSLPVSASTVCWQQRLLSHCQGCWDDGWVHLSCKLTKVYHMSRLVRGPCQGRTAACAAALCFLPGLSVSTQVWHQTYQLPITQQLLSKGHMIMSIAFA